MLRKDRISFFKILNLCGALINHWYRWFDNYRDKQVYLFINSLIDCVYFNYSNTYV